MTKTDHEAIYADVSNKVGEIKSGIDAARQVLIDVGRTGPITVDIYTGRGHLRVGVSSGDLSAFAYSYSLALTTWHWAIAEAIQHHLTEYLGPDVPVINHG